MTANKYHATRTWSALCNREFSSKAEATRGEELALLERAGEIRNLEYQPSWVLSERPKVTYTADFAYEELNSECLHVHPPVYPSCWRPVVSDVKGVLTRDTRTKLAWLRHDKPHITVTLLRLDRDGFHEVPWLGREPKPHRKREVSA